MEQANNMDRLKDRDYYIIVDKSGSMDEHDMPNGQPRWTEMQESVTAITRKLNEYDPDGITVIPFGSSYKVYPDTTPETIKNVWAENQPMGSTDLAPPLKFCMDEYLKRRGGPQGKKNGAIVVVITDGLPSDENEVAQSIIDFTKNIASREEFGIEFVQIGKDPHATAYLHKLDTALTGAKFDIVNAKTLDEVEKVGVTEAVMASLTD